MAQRGEILRYAIFDCIPVTVSGLPQSAQSRADSRVVNAIAISQQQLRLVAFRLFGDLNVRRQFRFGEGILNGYKLRDDNRQIVS
jgi:hypothetical protein